MRYSRHMLLRRAALTLTAVVLSVATIAAQSPPPIDVILARAGQYVSSFVERFASVVAEEHYVQDTLGNLPTVALGGRGSIQVGVRSRHRELKADFLLVKIGPADWLPFRDVFEVDGAAVRDREQRLQKLFLQSKTGRAGAGVPDHQRELALQHRRAAANASTRRSSR